MKFTTITAKFPGTCKRCSDRFPAGTRIRFGGKGLTYHLSADCPAGTVRDSGAAAIRNAAVTARNMGEPVGYTYDGPNDYTPVYDRPEPPKANNDAIETDNFAMMRAYNARKGRSLTEMAAALDANGATA